MGFPEAMTVHHGWTGAVSRGLAECEGEGKKRQERNCKDTILIPASFGPVF